MSSKYEFDPNDENDCKTVSKFLTALGYKTEDNDQHKKELEEKEKKIKELKEKTIKELEEKLAEEHKLYQQQKETNDALLKNFNDLQDQINSVPSNAPSIKEDAICLQVEDKQLKQTSNSTFAQYIAKKNEENIYSYQFNENYKNICDACQKYSEFIEPFCDIISKQDNANKITTETPGSGTYDFSSNIFTINTNAKVKLFKI